MDPATAVGLIALAFGVGAYGTIIGAGGGFVLIPGLVLLFGLDGVEAVGTGAVILAVIGLTGAVAYDRRGLVDRQVAASFALGSVPLALLASSLLAARIDSTVFIALLGFILLALAVFVVVVPPIVEDGSPPNPPMRDVLGLSGAAIGTMSGLFAVGGGLVTVPLLSRVQHLPAHRATATTSAAMSLSGLAAAIGHTLAGNVQWSKAAVMMAAAFVGSSIGARAAGRLSARVVLVLLATGLVAAGVPLLVEALT
ncbi:MAG: sulfite exporter TauE/SafE family protein [Acidimicrobiales bacterium]